MPRSFKLPGWNIKEPRVAMRAVIFTLLAINLVAAVIAFKPFGGSADDLRRDQERLRGQLAQLQAQVAKTKQHVDKVEMARTEGDRFLGMYMMDSRSASELMLTEMVDAAKAAGVKMGTQTFNQEAVEGSDTITMLSTQAGCEGSYAQLTKFVNLLDKSPRFLIIDGMTANAPQQQGGNVINVTLKILAFVKEQPGAAG